ncbi:MAG: hypothetical protein JXA46_17210 [Dehalococcoidales bacterium]|nr:hypothetical protein [Dehalococcoidales bacterium]
MERVLADTSVWVSHLREYNVELARLLNDNRVICHPFIIGEIACGNLGNRSEVLALLKNLPQADQIKHEEVLYFIEKHGLMWKGMGYVDICLAASAIMTGVPVWTLDRRFSRINRQLGIAYSGYDAAL